MRSLPVRLSLFTYLLFNLLHARKIFWDKVNLSVSVVQVVTTVMLYLRLIYLSGPFCMISISLAEAS